MTKELVERLWTPYKTLLEFDRVHLMVNSAIALSKEEPTHLIPNIHMGMDGAHLETIIMRSQRFIGELRLDNGFDFADAQSLVNYKVHLYLQTTRQPDGVSLEYSAARVDLIHVYQVHTRFGYVGNALDDWLRLVYDAFPVELLLRSMRPRRIQ